LYFNRKFEFSQNQLRSFSKTDQLEQQFLVLKEKKDGESNRGVTNSHRPRRGHFGHESGSRKRVREEDEDDGDWSRESLATRGRVQEDHLEETSPSVVKLNFELN